MDQFIHEWFHEARRFYKPFTTYNKSAAEDFENIVIYIKDFENIVISIKGSLIVK